jgi:hypothetical protein
MRIQLSMTSVLRRQTGRQRDEAIPGSPFDYPSREAIEA